MRPFFGFTGLTMRKYAIPLLLLAAPVSHAQDNKDWNIYSDIDLFAYSEVISIREFVDDFQDDIVSGDNAFTHDKFEIGVKWKKWRFAYVDRFDYITEFTNDTAFIHHAEKNDLVIPTNRNYDLLLDVERLNAKGLKAGYTWDVRDNLTLDFSGNYYFNIKKLQSGKVELFANPDPINAQLVADAEAIIDTLDFNNRDLTPLRNLAANIQASLLIDYAYDDPKFREDRYQEPVIDGPPNPPLTGVDFSEPDGWGYSFDFGVNWQVNDQLNLDLQLIDVANAFEWKDAPQTYAAFDLNAFLVDAIDVVQDFITGGIVDPNGPIDRNLTVQIFNDDYTQKLPMRADFNARYSLDKELNIFNWTPNVSLLGGYYHTRTEDFPRLGVAFDNNLDLMYDIQGEALMLNYRHKYFFVNFIADDFNLDDAKTFGIAVGVNYSF